MQFEHIKALVLDVDGVLTDGRLYFDSDGESLKVFHVHDGTAIKRWIREGRFIALLSGRQSAIVQRRAAELGVTDVVQGAAEKLDPFHRLVKAWSLTVAEVCYVGDDTPDIAPMRACGYAVAVANARPEVKQYARYVTVADGGCGAAREVIDHLLPTAHEHG